MWGLLALAVWAIAPRWRTMLPWAGSYLARAADRLSERPAVDRGLAALRWVFGGYERWRSLHLGRGRPAVTCFRTRSSGEARTVAARIEQMAQVIGAAGGDAHAVPDRPEPGRRAAASTKKGL